MDDRPLAAKRLVFRMSYPGSDIKRQLLEGAFQVVNTAESLEDAPYVFSHIDDETEKLTQNSGFCDQALETVLTQNALTQNALDEMNLLRGIEHPVIVSISSIGCRLRETLIS